GDRLALRLDLPPGAGGTDGFSLTSRAAAVRTRFREHHVPARRLHRAGAMAVRASALARVQPARAAARPAVRLSCDSELPLPAANRLFEGQRDRLVEIGAPRRFVALPRLALMKDVGKEIAEGRRRRAADG